MPLCTIDTCFSGFRNAAKAASKRHRFFTDELGAVFEEIEKSPYSVGDRINNLGDDIHVRKIRIGVAKEHIAPPNGYRLILQILTIDNSLVARCLDLYYKPKKSNTSSREVKDLAKQSAVQVADRKQNAESDQ